jgi:hypothetical protein
MYARELSHVLSREPYKRDYDCGVFSYRKDTDIDRIEVRPYG